MSYLDLDNMSPQDLILHYVLECRGQGHFLPYLDYEVIDEWLRLAPSADDLLLVLSEVLPDYFDKNRESDQSGQTRHLGRSRSGPVRSLRGAKRLVVSRLKERAMVHCGSPRDDE